MIDYLHNFIERAKRETSCDVLIGDINHYRFKYRALLLMCKTILEESMPSASSMTGGGAGDIEPRRTT